MASVDLIGICKDYDGTEVMTDLSLSVADGEFLVLVGPSGCGKSTLLRMIAGLEEISDGDLKIGDRIVNDLTPKQRDIAMVFQNYALYPHMTVARNMSFALRLDRRPPGEIGTRVGRASGILGLDDYMARFPRQLSGGQRQRVAMGRAIVRDPAVFLFDEPLSNLDAKLRLQMRAEIKKLHRLLGTTTIYVTHDQVEAMTLADRVVVMQHGKIEQVGTPLALYDRPDTLFVAGFIGAPPMGFLTAQAAGGVVTFQGTPLPVTAPAGLSGPVTVAVRPEDIRIDPDALAKGLPVTVDFVEPTGADTIVGVTMGGETLLVSARERLSVDIGDTVHIAFAPGRLHLFDPATGRRVD